MKIPSCFNIFFSDEAGLEEYEKKELISIISSYTYDIGWKVEFKARMARAIAKWMINGLFPLLDSNNILCENSPISPNNFFYFVWSAESNCFTNITAKEVLKEMFNTSNSVFEVCNNNPQYLSITDKDVMLPVVEKVCHMNIDIIQKILDGKEQAKGALFGKIMKEFTNRSDPEIVNRLLDKELNYYKEINVIIRRILNEKLNYYKSNKVIKACLDKERNKK